MIQLGVLILRHVDRQEIMTRCIPQMSIDKSLADKKVS